MRVLVACEFSGVVRNAFTALGHDAMSCDLLPTERPGPHLKCDVRTLPLWEWDLMIAHPPCTHLASSGARWFKNKAVEQKEALEFIRFLMNAPVKKIAIENPVGIISTHIRKPDQIIQPWQYGHPTTKATCLWLKNLPNLVPTNIVEPEYHRNSDGSVYRDKKGRRYSELHYSTFHHPDRWKNRSRTYTGIAEAMAQQWGAINPPTKSFHSMAY